MVLSDSDNDKMYPNKEQNSFEVVVEVPDSLNPFIKKLEEITVSLNNKLENIESSLEQKIINTQQNISNCEDNIKKELTSQIGTIYERINKIESNYDQQNSDLDYLKKELINIASKLEIRVDELIPLFRTEIDRISSHAASMEQLNRHKFQEINNGIEKISRTLPTSEEIYQKLTNEQSNLATKTQITDLKIEMINNTKDMSKEIGAVSKEIGVVSKELGEIKGKLSSNFVTVMGGIVLTLATLFGTIITVSNTISNSIFKQAQPQVLQSGQPIPRKIP